MRNFFRDFRWDYFYLGAALGGFAKLGLVNWQLWAILIPFAILNLLIGKKNEKKI